jgi:hypothetical protein
MFPGQKGRWCRGRGLGSPTTTKGILRSSRVISGSDDGARAAPFALENRWCAKIGAIRHRTCSNLNDNGFQRPIRRSSAP